jgi:hypothetical protein
MKGLCAAFFACFPGKEWNSENLCRPYHRLTTGQAYDESVFIQEAQKQAQRHERRLRMQAKTLGFELVPIAA